MYTSDVNIVLGQ